MKKCEQMPCPQTGLCLSTVLQAITVHQSNKHKGQLLSVWSGHIGIKMFGLLRTAIIMSFAFGTSK